MTQPRLKDWTDLGATERAGAYGLCHKLANQIQREFSPFVELLEAPVPNGTGPLDGLPYGAKDMFQLPGRAPSWGLAQPVAGLPTGVKSDVLSQLDEAGARCVGFTRMTALAYEPSGVNPLQSPPLNPWNSAFAPGASSSGSAVAVASGAAFVALGSDTGGSLRIPAQGCGVTAWKPTNGSLSTHGAMPLAPSLDAIGVLARSARDIAAVRSAMLPHETVNLDAAGRITIKVLHDAIDASESSVRSTCQMALGPLSGAGVALENQNGLPLIESAGNEALIVMQAEAAHAHRARLEMPDFDPLLAKRLSKGLEISDHDLSSSLARRADIRRTAFDEVLGGADMMLLPAMPIRTPLLSETDPSAEHFSARTLYALSNYTRFANYLGLPAVAFPVGFDDNQMPVAMQLVGRPGADAQLLAAVTAFQAETVWHGRLPTALLELRSYYGDLLL